MNIRVVLYHYQLGETIPKKNLIEIKNFSPHFVCFPEYFFVQKNLGTMVQTEHNQKLQLKRLEALSIYLNCTIIGGSMPELADNVTYNTTFVYHKGIQIGSYRKNNLFFPEVGHITPGTELEVLEIDGIRFGLLICADVFHDNSFDFMKENNAQMVFIPTFSPKKDEDVEVKHKRDKEIYVRGAQRADATLIKVCGVPSPFKDFIQARTLIADKNDIIYRTTPEEENKNLIIKRTIEM